jgi:hypothetical protein
MSDEELVKRLRAVDHLDIEDCFMQSPLYAYAADRIELLATTNEQLDATNEALAGGCAEANKRGDAWRFRADIAEVKLAECLERNALLEARLGKAVELLTLCRDMFDEVAHPSDPLSMMLNDELAFEPWGEQP